MKSCRYVLCVLVVLTITTDSGSAVPTVKVDFNGTAVLPCSERCSGKVRWTVFQKRSDTLAECDQTECRSVKQGNQMIHDQYLKGDLSLIITEADFSKRGYYTCDCVGRDVCDVRLQVEALNTTVQIRSGESLVMELDVADPVEVIYSSSGAAGTSSGQICTVNELQCSPEYTQRTSLAVELRGLMESDSGVYTVRDIRNKADIHIYTVRVKDEQQSQMSKDEYEKGYGDGYQKGLGVGGASFGIVALIVGVILGTYVVPLVRPLWGRCVQRFRNAERDEAQDVGAGEVMM